MLSGRRWSFAQMAEVILEGVTKQFPDGTKAVDNVSLNIQDREFLVLVGPSGCGKSTTLRLVAGLESLSHGTIRIGGRAVNDLPPKDRDIAMVFQNYALYPHMTVYKNLAFGLRLRYGGGFGARVLRRLINPRRSAELSALRSGIDARVRQAAARLSIEKLLHRKPHELSGGERQRVALGRAIVRDPAAFLFDEPLSNLDAKLRQQMRTELKQLHKSLAATTIYVTHDQIEAMTLGQRVVVMDRGQIQQIAPPQVVYREPANLFVARFFGSTPLNLVKGNLDRNADELEFVCGPFRLKLTDQLRSAAGFWPRQITLGFRSEDLRITDESPKLGWELPAAEVTQVDRWGDASVVYFRWAAESLVAKLAGDVHARVGDRMRFSLDAERVMWFDTATELNLVKNKS